MPGLDGRSTVLPGPPLALLWEDQKRGEAPSIQVLDALARRRFGVADASLLALNETGRLALVERWAEPHTFEIWNTSRGQGAVQLAFAEGDENGLGPRRFAPDERSLVLPIRRASNDDAYVLFELASGAALASWPASYMMGDVPPSFSGDSRQLAAVDLGGTATSLVEVATGKTITRSTACPRPYGTSFTKRGDLLAVAGRTHACVFSLPNLVLRWRVHLQTEKTWERIDYHNDLRIVGMVGDDAAVVIAAAQASRLFVLDIASGRRIFQGCGHFAAQTGTIETCNEDGHADRIAFDGRATPKRQPLSDAELSDPTGLSPEAWGRSHAALATGSSPRACARIASWPTRSRGADERRATSRPAG